MKKRFMVIILIMVFMISFAIIFSIISWNKNSGIEYQTAKCIRQNSEIYVQLGCHACETQEKLFGANYKELKVVDCFYEREKCSEIQYTPTWIIKGEKYTGVQSIEKLKELTGC